MNMAIASVKKNDRRVQMIPAGKGCWLTVQRLPAGAYRFEYLADGRRGADRAAFGMAVEPPQPLCGRAA